ncbi:MAG: Calx-beta domain-containing protein [Acidimicrobiales bacterium]
MRVGAFSAVLTLAAVTGAAAAAPSAPLEVAAPVVPVVLPGLGTVAAPLADMADLDVPVTLSTSSADPVSVRWTTLDVPRAPVSSSGPEAAPRDYTASSGVVTFAPGQTAAHVTVPVNGDTAGSGEYVVVSFTEATGATMGGFWGLGFGIIDPVDYGPVPTISYDFPQSFPVPAAGATFVTHLSLDVPTNHVVTVHWSTAELGDYFVNTGLVAALIVQAPTDDYVAASGTVTFQPGEVSKDVAVTIVHCTCPAIAYQSSGPVSPDHGEMIWLTASDATGALIGPYYSYYQNPHPGQPNLLYPA